MHKQSFCDVTIRETTLQIIDNDTEIILNNSAEYNNDICRYVFYDCNINISGLSPF